MNLYSGRYKKLWLIALFGLLMIAMLINLASHHAFVHTDEARRSVVSLEMLLSGNYLVPTIQGEYYLNKPPLYNWLLAAVFKLWGEPSILAQRLVSVFFCFSLAASVYLICKRQWQAALAPLFFIVNARVLFYDSFLGMIDFPFSFVSFLQIYSIYYFYEKRNWTALFLVSYLLMCMGFLMKALPSVAFQGGSLLALAWFSGSLRLFFRKEHFYGVLLGLAILGIYYAAYLSAVSLAPSELIATILDESTRRTVVRFGWTATLKHLLVFPFDFIINFSPWSWIVLLFFHREIRQRIWRDNQSRFLIMAFVINILPYWTSPEVAPRYLLTHFALLSPVLLRILVIADELNKDFISKVFMGFSLLIGAVSIVLPYLEQGRSAIEQPGIWPFIFGLPAVLVASYVIRANMLSRTWMLLFVLIVARLNYSVFMLPKRAYNRLELKNQAEKIAELTKSKPLFTYKDTPIHDGSIYYISSNRGEILRRSDEVINGSYYLVRFEDKNSLPVEEIMPFRTLNVPEQLYLVKARFE